ncbi:MAG TPA: fibronectin type III domain-containing protein [Pyrinomonadaceae bacterium]|nr:fibronectin type III domain-containing protein [Pyrinomonadaceae bacterium]
MNKEHRLLRVFPFADKSIHKYLVVLLALALLGVPASVAPVISAPKTPPKTLKIIQLYSTAETSTSAAVVWNTNIASDSLVQYSTTNPVPASAPTMYSASQVTYHEFALSGLAPGTLYFYKVTSCTRKACVTASGSFDTFPSCPDIVPPASGSWQRTFSPNISGATAVTNQLLSVAAVSENDVWAVGWAQDPNGPPYFKRPLAQHFDGGTWNIVPSPNPANDTQSVLHSVSATSANDVWAVGVTHNGSFPARTLIQHWDGTEWRIVPSPNPDDQVNELHGVAALSANDVWAVGFSFGSQSESNIDTLILHWDGVSWSEVATPNNVLGVANQLFGIAAISTNDIWAVGSAGGEAISMHWNGSAWSTVPLPQDAGLSSEVLAAVSGSAGNDVWVVGRGKGIFSNQTFATIRHWNGARWTQKVCRAASASNPPDGYEGGGPDSYLTGISAAASNDVWAVGVVGSGPIILHWDGQAWTTVTHPRAFPNSHILRGVATTTGGSAWSVGGEIEVSPSGSASPERTLIERYTP